MTSVELSHHMSYCLTDLLCRSGRDRDGGVAVKIQKYSSARASFVFCLFDPNGQSDLEFGKKENNHFVFS